MPTLLNRVLSTLITTVSGDVAIHSVRALLHFVWQITSVGKIDNLKAFVKYIFYVDYTSYFRDSKNLATLPTIHEELIVNLVLLLKQNGPVPDLTQINRLLKNCWFFLEITIKSLCLYTIQFKRYHKNSSLNPKFDSEFYNSLKSFYDILVEIIVKYGNSTKDPEFVNAHRSCNRSLAMFIKKSLNLLNRKFLFSLISSYLEHFHLGDKVCERAHLFFFQAKVKI